MPRPTSLCFLGASAPPTVHRGVVAFTDRDARVQPHYRTRSCLKRSGVVHSCLQRGAVVHSTSSASRTAVISACAAAPSLTRGDGVGGGPRGQGVAVLRRGGVHAAGRGRQRSRRRWRRRRQWRRGRRRQRAHKRHLRGKDWHVFQLDTSSSFPPARLRSWSRRRHPLRHHCPDAPHVAAPPHASAARPASSNARAATRLTTTSRILARRLIHRALNIALVVSETAPAPMTWRAVSAGPSYPTLFEPSCLEVHGTL